MCRHAFFWDSVYSTLFIRSFAYRSSILVIYPHTYIFPLIFPIYLIFRSLVFSLYFCQRDFLSLSVFQPLLLPPPPSQPAFLGRSFWYRVLRHHPFIGPSALPDSFGCNLPHACSSSSFLLINPPPFSRLYRARARLMPCYKVHCRSPAPQIFALLSSGLLLPHGGYRLGNSSCLGAPLAGSLPLPHPHDSPGYAMRSSTECWHQICAADVPSVS